MPLTSAAAGSMVGVMLRTARRTARLRPPAAAGRFYPATPGALQENLDWHLRSAALDRTLSPKAVVAPHAGYPYSGPVAGYTFAACRSWSRDVRRVVVVGPSHFESFSGLAVTTVEAFATPLGEMPVDREAVEQLVQRRLARVHEPAHQVDHAIEVELPFLQTLLPEATLVPILAGQTTGEQVAETLDLLWGGPETAVVISSDLSHYLDYDRARRVDHETCLAIEALDPGPVDSHHACGHFPLQGLLQVARARALRPVTLDLRNSGDTAGSRDRVVGYGAWAFADQEQPPRQPAGDTPARPA